METTTITLHTQFQIGRVDPRLHVFVTNRSPDESATVRVKLADRDIVALESAELLTGPGAKAANSFEQPDVVQSRPFTEVRFAQGVASAELGPLSVAALTFKLEKITAYSGDRP